MPHIPEEELHAYLDQALDRLRCVEIESHLAECTGCRDARDGIAALRDRTTALLARLAPRRTAAPSYAEIRRRAQARVRQRERVLQRLAWAASVVLALGIGWTASALYRAPATRVALEPVAAPAAPAMPAPAEAPAPEVPLPEPNVAAPPAPRVDVAPEAAAPKPAPVASAPLVPTPLPAGDAWRTVTWHPARSAPRESTPADAPPIAAEERAADSTPRGGVTTRQLASGEVIRAFEGAATDVSSLLSGGPSGSQPAARAPSTAPPPADAGGSLAYRRGGSPGGTSVVPSDSLRAMMRRLNLMLRVR
ncbi:MAG TPA: zf-HC2 domain-containing protein [Gemmatimonadales bacterium]|nr:zf-HC2 domain-containing protein [Gemmatimonadales bacterium]